jgi:hypothetical protein
MAFDSNYPDMLQTTSWSCSATSVAWCMSAMGIPTSEWGAISLLGGRISSWDGLEASDGSGLVQMLQEQGIAAYSIDYVDFDTVAQLAGKQPLCLGGRGAYHWMAVRAYDVNNDMLHIMNPAPNYLNLQEYVDRGEFARFGSWALVVISHADVTPTVVPDSEDDMSELQECKTTIDGLRTVLGYITGDNEGDIYHALRNAQMMQDWGAVDAALNTLAAQKPQQ